MAITEYIRNADRAILNTDRAVLNTDRAVLNTDRAILNTVFEITVRSVNNVWRLAEDTLNITCKFLFCNHVHREFFDHPVLRQHY
jgi:hypothetical protein